MPLCVDILPMDTDTQHCGEISMEKWISGFYIPLKVKVSKQLHSCDINASEVAAA